STWNKGNPSPPGVRWHTRTMAMARPRSRSSDAFRCTCIHSAPCMVGRLCLDPECASVHYSVGHGPPSQSLVEPPVGVDGPGKLIPFLDARAPCSAHRGRAGWVVE